MRAALPPGIRVVRGPNWIWQNQGMCHSFCLLYMQTKRTIDYPALKNYT